MAWANMVRFLMGWGIENESINVERQVRDKLGSIAGSKRFVKGAPA